MAVDEDAIADAYGHVADGYERALKIHGLPDVELEDLRVCYRAALELARRPWLYPVARSTLVEPGKLRPVA